MLEGLEEDGNIVAKKSWKSSSILKVIIVLILKYEYCINLNIAQFL